MLEIQLLTALFYSYYGRAPLASHPDFVWTPQNCPVLIVASLPTAEQWGEQILQLIFVRHNCTCVFCLKFLKGFAFERKRWSLSQVCHWRVSREFFPLLFCSGSVKRPWLFWMKTWIFYNISASKICSNKNNQKRKILKCRILRNLMLKLMYSLLLFA